MAMKKRFYTMNSQMMAYDEGGVTKDFLTDHLGSITAEIDQTQTRTYDTRYSAYGRNNWSTGTGCGFGWVGTYGYRETGLFHMSHYVRARHYSYVTGVWSTVDPLWPDESAYGYVGGRATASFDPTGEHPACIGACIGCSACLIDLLIVCPPTLDGTWADCVSGLWDELPGWVKWGCGIACGGCLACVAKELISKIKPRPGPAPVRPPKPTPRGGPRKGCRNKCPMPGFRIDWVPPSAPHPPCPGDHIHWFVYDQTPPPACVCMGRWRKQPDCLPPGSPPPKNCPPGPPKPGKR
jgi:RHS repeat-associated protein